MNGYQQYFKKRKEVFLKKKKRRSPIRSRQGWLMIVAMTLTLGGGAYLFSTDEATNLLSKIEVSLIGEASAETKQHDKGSGKDEAKSAQANGKEEEKKSDDEAKAAADLKAQPKSWSEAEVTLFTKLESRKKQLDAKEAELSKLEEDLQKQKEDLEKRLTALEEVRVKISAKLEDKVKVDQQRVDTLVSVYANMKPSQAAKVLEGLNEDLAVEVLSKMKNKNAAEILNLMDSDKAKHISEKFAGFREPAAAGH